VTGWARHLIGTVPRLIANSFMTGAELHDRRREIVAVCGTE
jgi:hypothetical protein